MFRSLHMAAGVIPAWLRAGTRSRSAGAAALAAALAAGLLAVASPARADSNIDALICLNGASAALSFVSPSVTWPQEPALTWSASLPAACATAGGGFYLMRGDTPFSSVGFENGDSTISIPAAQAWGYTWSLRVLTVQGEDDFGSAQETVTFPGPLTDGRTDVTVASNSDADRTLFVQAVQTPKVTVHVAGDVNLDLSGLDPLPVAAGVQIIGDRSVNRAGPRLFTTTFPRLLFKIGDDGNGVRTPAPSDGVRISGIRLDGGESDDAFSAVGEQDSDGIGVFSSIGVMIDHDELYHWRGAAVNVHDGNGGDSSSYVGRINKDNLDAVQVVDNYIHHNQHPSTADCGISSIGHSSHAAGYGVEASDGAYVSIRRNVFDWNRHSIAGDGKHGTGYSAWDNLILPDGGIDLKCVSPGAGIALLLNPFVGIQLLVAGALDGDHIYHTHAIDMHATGSCPLSGAEPLADHNCGPAGEYMDIEDNTILYTAGNGIHLRGTPAIGMFVANNVFAHQVHDGGLVTPGAMVGNEQGLYDMGNTLGLNTFNDRKYCDFDGDGVPDPFIATGVTWWYSSSVLGGRWVYLNQSPARVTDVTLGDVDGDGRCDVTWSGGVLLNPDPQPLAHNPGGQATTVGSYVSMNLAASGGTKPYGWAVTGLPPGLSPSASGQISGVLQPGGPSAYPVTATVIDATGQQSTVTFTWTVDAVVPSLGGLDVGGAQAALGTVGLNLGNESLVFNCTDEPGTVLGQNPSAGQVVVGGSSVNVSVSSLTDGRGHHCVLN